MPSYFHMKSGVEVTWFEHNRTYLYHASVDGKVAVCGAVNLKPIHAHVPYPATDLMACENCQGLVREVK